MLDNCSQGFFIKEEIIEELGITERKLKLSLKTLTATTEKIKKWKYLNRITAEITQDDDIKVDMLVGALELVKITASQDGEPYVYKTKLGLCIIGPIVSNKNGKALSCNRIVVKDAITGKLLSHHFVRDIKCPGYKMRDICVEEMFRKIYQNYINQRYYWRYGRDIQTWQDVSSYCRKRH